MNLSSSIMKIKGIGEKTAQSFEKLNIVTVEDVINHFPRNYFRYPEALSIYEMEADDSLREGICAIRAIVRKSPLSRNARNMNVTTLTIGEG